MICRNNYLKLFCQEGYFYIITIKGIFYINEILLLYQTNDYWRSFKMKTYKIKKPYERIETPFQVFKADCFLRSTFLNYRKKNCSSSTANQIVLGNSISWMRKRLASRAHAPQCWKWQNFKGFPQSIHTMRIDAAAAAAAAGSNWWFTENKQAPEAVSSFTRSEFHPRCAST